jgi:Concanavalin A-like lectin/glucanases superfamily
MKKALCWLLVFNLVSSLLAVSISPSGGDDTSAIQTALTNLNSGETLNFNAGTYLVSSTLELRQDNVTITFLNGAKLEATGTGMAQLFLSFADDMTFNDLNIDGKDKCNLGLQLYKCQNVTLNRPVIKNIYGDWGGTSTHAQGIRVRTCTNVDILNGTFENMIATTGDASGIYCSTVSATEKCSQITIKGCSISNVKANNDSDGIKFLSNGIADLDINSSIEDCEFYNCYKRAIKLQSDNINITNVTIVNDFMDESVRCSYLIDFQSADDCVLDGADITFTGCSTAAIGLGGNDNVIKNINIRLTRKSIDSTGTHFEGVWAIRNQGWDIDGLELKNVNIYGDFEQAVRIADIAGSTYDNITLDNIYSKKQLLFTVTSGTGYTVKNSTFGSYYYGSANVTQTNLITAQLNPVAHYKLDESSGQIIDVSDNNNDSSATDSLTYSEGGIINDAIGFNGSSSYVKIPNSTSLNELNHHITIATWIYPDADEQSCIVNKKWDGDNNGLDFRTYSSRRLLFRIGDGTLNITKYSDADSLTLDTWQHVAVVYNGASVKFYVNGQLKGSSLMAGQISANTRSIYIGKHQGSSSYFDGKLDDVRIYNRSLTPYELKEAAYMSAYYKLDGNGTDETGYNSATVNGPPATVSAQVDTGFDFYATGQYLNAGDNDAFDLGSLGGNSNSMLTISAWINPDAADFNKTIIGKGTTTSTDGYELRAYGTTLRFWINNSYVQSAGILTYGILRHVAITYDGAEVKFYVNGELKDTESLTAGVPASNSYDMTIGIYTDKSSYRFNGTIDDVKLFKSAFNAESITELFSEGWMQN